MSDWRGFIILFFSLGVPALLLLQRRERELLAWVCLSVGVNVFDARVGLNLPAARLVGLMVLPYLPLGEFRFGELLRTRPFRILLAGFAYLAFLGVIYGFLYPWPNEGFLRPFVMTAPGRFFVYSVRLLSDFGVTLFVVRRVMRGTLPDELIRYLLIGSSMAVVGGLLEWITGVQLYQVLTGYPIQEVAGRVRGFNFEPRGLGLAMVHGAFFAILWSTYRRSRFALGLAVAHLGILVLAVSASALMAAAFAWLCLVVFERRVRLPLLGFGAVAASAVALALMVGKDLPLAASWTTNLTQRFTIGQAVDLATHTPIEVVAQFLDIFDYTAFMVLTSSPLAALIGTGPGLIILPGSAFIPADGKWLWVTQSGEGITSQPSMGILLEWGNGGVLTLVLWAAFVVTCWRALSALARRDSQDAASWALGRAAFTVVAGVYLVQASAISAIWPIFMGIGIGAAVLGLRPARTREKSRVVAVEGLA